MGVRKVGLASLILYAILSLAAAAPSSASNDEFYKGKVVQLVIGFGAGGTYDLYGQLVAHYIGRFLPGNPTVVPESMPTAGSLNAANYLYNVAPRDGTVFGTVASGAPTMPFFYPSQARFDASKLTWIGSVAKAIFVDVVTARSNIRTVHDLQTKQVIIGGAGPGAGTVDLPRLMNAIGGFHYKIILGYNAVPDVYLAMTKGEVQGVSGTTWDSMERNPYYYSGAFKVIVQYGAEKVPQLANVPLAISLATNPSDRAAMNLLLARQEMGKPFVAPPNLPPQRTAELREAFMKMTKDKDFLAAAKKAQLDVDPLDGAAVQKLVDDVIQTPPGVVARVKKILQAD
jgi:tripartite-type tricarboxylate transporter receptor subunit TctC